MPLRLHNTAEVRSEAVVEKGGVESTPVERVADPAKVVAKEKFR